MRYIRQLCCVSLLCLSGSAVAANVRLQVEGLSGQLEKNVRAQLSTIESDEVTPDRRFRARVDDAIREGLKALGYYQPTIEFDPRPPPKKGRQVLIASHARRAGVNWRHRCGIARRRGPIKTI
ncbi:POTRA domain-containing protein [Escherichia coli]